MAGKSAEVQARDFIYELNNCASEYGFSKEELWEVDLVSEKEKIKLEKKYYPTISALTTPEFVPVMLGLVHIKLPQFISETPAPAGKTEVIKGIQQYLIAYSAKRTL
jgi:hypothetical protein